MHPIFCLKYGCDKNQTEKKVKSISLIMGWNSILINLKHIASLKVLLGTALFLIHLNRMV